jgi:hypothetical protein
MPLKKNNLRDSMVKTLNPETIIGNLIFWILTPCFWLPIFPSKGVS